MDAFKLSNDISDELILHRRTVHGFAETGFAENGMLEMKFSLDESGDDKNNR